MQPEFLRERTVALPAESCLRTLFAGADLADAYAIALPPDTERDVGLLAKAVLGDPAGWVQTLMRLRDIIVGRIGLKTSVQIRDRAMQNGTDRINFFPIRSHSERELVVGEDDSHLDFRTSILLRPGQAGTADELVVTTIVHCRNRLGVIYLTAIAPFHRLIVRSSLRRAAGRGWRIQ